MPDLTLHVLHLSYLTLLVLYMVDIVFCEENIFDAPVCVLNVPDIT